MSVNSITGPINIRDTVSTDVAVTTSAAQTTPLSAGIYDITSTANVRIKIAATASDVTVANGYLLYGGNTVPFIVGEGDRIGYIAPSGTATLTYQKTGSVS